MNERALYQEWNWNIIPLAKNSKEPLGGLNLQKYFTTKYPSDTIPSDLNLGVITGKTSGISVIDVDDESKVQHYLTHFPTHRIQKTPHGYHLFYWDNPNLPAIKKIDGGDWFNGNHYVVVSPSKVGNLQYEWLEQGELGIIPDDAFVQKQVSIQSGKYTRTEIYELINYALAEGKPLEGAGNDTILYGSMVLAGDGWTVPALLVLMKNLNNARTSPEPEHVVESMVQRGAEYSKSNKKPEVQALAHGLNFEILSYGAMLQKYDNYTADWLVDGWLPESSIIICSALPERYKTWLSVDLAISVASGMDFLQAFTVEKPGKVLVVQQEDFGPEFIARFKTVERAKIAQSNLSCTLESTDGEYTFIDPHFIGESVFFHEDAELSLDNDESVQKLEERIKEVDAKLCIIDPFYSLSTNDDYFAKTAAKIRQEIKRIRNETGCTFFFVHHNKKSAKSETGDNLSRDQIYGSTFVNAVMEGAWTVGRDNEMGEAEVLVYRRFKTKKVAIPTKIKFHIDMNAENDSEAYWLDVQELSEDNRILILAFLSENGPATFSELFEQFQYKFGSKSTFTSFIKGLVGHGIQQEGKRGKYSVEPDAS